MKRIRPAAPETAPKRRRTVTADKAKPDTAAVSTIAKAIMELEIEYRNIDDLKDYEFNPRDNHDAIQYVANSIRQFGFTNPIVIDKDDVIIIGHTRKAGAKLIGMTRVPTIKVEHLSEEQVKAFRIVDNKVGEIATWNYELLAREIQALGSSIDMIELGFAAEQIDCLSAMVEEDCLSVANSLMTGSGLDTRAGGNAPTSSSTAPATTRWVLGELVITMPAEVHRAWITALREECEFDQKTMINTIYSKLGVDHVAD